MEDYAMHNIDFHQEKMRRTKNSKKNQRAPFNERKYRYIIAFTSAATVGGIKNRFYGIIISY